MDELDRKEFKTVVTYLEGKLNECGKRRKRLNPDSPKQLEQMINTIVRALAIDETSASGLNIPVVNARFSYGDVLKMFTHFSENTDTSQFYTDGKELEKEITPYLDTEINILNRR